MAGESDGKSLDWLPDIERHLKVQSEISYEKFHQNRFKRAYMKKKEPI